MFGKAEGWGDPCLGRRKGGVAHVWEGKRVGTMFEEAG